VLGEKRQDSLILTAYWVIGPRTFNGSIAALITKVVKDSLNLVTKLSFWASLSKVSSETVYNAQISGFKVNQLSMLILDPSCFGQGE
jgi:hypothetical protein